CNALTVAALTCILRLTGVSSCSVGTEMSMETYTRLLMDANPEFPIHFLNIYSDQCAERRSGGSPHIWPRSAPDFDTVTALALFVRWSPDHGDTSGSPYRPVGRSRRLPASVVPYSTGATATCAAAAHRASTARVPSAPLPHHTPHWWRADAGAGGTARYGHGC